MADLRRNLLDLGALLVVLCAVGMTALTLRDRLGGHNGSPPQGRRAPEFVESWDQISKAGHIIGPDSAAVTVMVFSDFECPMCAYFATRTYPEFQDLHPGETRLIYRHWPLSQHRFSYPAARAAECAARQGRFAEFHDRLYAEQRSLGLKTFPEFGLDAGIPNMEAFENCLNEKGPVAAIERDIRQVRELGGIGTPTILVNGWLLKGGVDRALLDSIAGPLFDQDRQR